jgi:two-component system, sensor histidine kinase
VTPTARRVAQLPPQPSDLDPMTVVGHELRASLTLLNGYLSMMDGAPEGTRKQYVTIMQSIVAEMDRTSEVLVIAARLDTGVMPHSPREFDARDIAASAIMLVGPRAELEGATIDVRASHGRTRALADPFHVTRIVSNLLNNALSYSPRPAVVTVELRPGDPVAIAVCDRGVGIAPELQTVVFDPFRRLDGVTPGRGRGLGLGLHISREMAALNGGSLVLEHSEPGKGSTFVLRLPAATGRPG